MEPSLVVIGLNFRSAPVSVRERFWISDCRRYDALHQLVRSEGIDEAIVLTTCNRTEIIVWASDAAEAANSVLRFLTREYDLKLCEWSSFYRLLDEIALQHVFRVASGLDSMVIGESEIAEAVKTAWQMAQKAGTTGHFLDAVIQKALSVSQRVRKETSIGASGASIPFAAFELCKQTLGSAAGRNVVLLGAGKMSEMAARYLLEEDAKSLKVINRTFEHASELATKLGGTPATFDKRHEHMKEADIVVSSTSCPHFIFGKHDAEFIMRGREDRPLVIIDLAVPRNIDPLARNVAGIHLHDMDDVERTLRQDQTDQQGAIAEANTILLAEAQGFRRKLTAEHVAPTIIALRSRLDEICRQELTQMGEEYGPFTEDQQKSLKTLAAHITQRIAGSLARELKDLPEHSVQEALTTAVQRLFNLEMNRTVVPANQD